MILLRQAALRAIEQRFATASPPLMERAGRAAAALLRERFGTGRVLVCAGPGNNGGDGFVLARALHRAGQAVSVRFAGDPQRLPADAAAAWQSARAAGVDFCAEPSGKFSVVVDALFGIGLRRPLDGDWAALVERINRFPGPVLALDVPSGLDADTGACHGPAVGATLTASFIAGKPGLYTGDGPDCAGEVVLLDLGLGAATTDIDTNTAIRHTDTTANPAPPRHHGALLTAADLRLPPPRVRASHKGSFGTLAVIGGASGMSGAALLAARAGLHLGAGRVMAGLLQPLTVDPLQPELMLRPPEEALAGATAAVVGPGLGQSGAALNLLHRAAGVDFPLLLDADALNLLAAHPVLARTIARRAAPTLLTPHPTEAARLLGIDTATVQADRIAAACRLASRFHAEVALKGAGTVLASPDGSWRINPTGNPGLASGGTGDVLAGMAGALLAQGLPARDALAAAVFLHGAAADERVAAGHGPAGLTAGELLLPARRLLNRRIAGLA